MEVAGSAVGIASLGTQVCQSLLSYYDAWKTYGSDISSTYNAITDLSKTLTILETTLQQETDQERIKRVSTCIIGCKDGLLELEEKWRSLQRYSHPEGLRQKTRAELETSWYPFRKETLKSLEASVISIQEHLKLALQVLQLDVGTESEKLVLRSLSQSTTQSPSIAQTAAQNQRILGAQQSNEFQKIVAWLAPPDPGTNHDTARQRHESQTGEWLLRSSQYQSWKTGVVSHLWMYGKAGCGKTTLCSKAIEDVRITFEQDTDTSFAFFYFSFSDERKQSDSDLLRSLVAQLGWREPGLSMLREAYGDAKRSVPGSDELEKIFLASVRSCSKVYLLVDALDECPEDYGARQSVLARIERLTQAALNLRILATSRELDRIRESMEALTAEPLPVTTRAVDDDIKIYLAGEMSRDRRFRELSPEMRALIENTIASQADGMFRWAYCQLQELKNLKSYKPKFIEQVLQTLPPTLDDTYTRMLTRIEVMYHQEALTLLRWLAYARSPPTLGELMEAAITDPMEEGFVDTSERGGLHDALNILSGLVTIEESQVIDTKNYSRAGFITNDAPAAGDAQGASTVRSQHLTGDTRVRLAHFSVKEYLESQRILNSSARPFYLKSATGHRALSQSCLTYLRYYSESSEKTSTSSDFIIFPLLEYAAQSWFFHSAQQQSEGVDRELSLLLQQERKKDWLLVHDPDKPWHVPFRRSEFSGSAVYYASLLGLQAVVKYLLGSGEQVNTHGGYHGDALQAASSRGHFEVMQLLLDNGARVNARAGEYGHALLAATLGSHRKAMKLLLDNGANVNARGGYYGNALQAASFGGRAWAVHLLLEKGADVNAQGGYYGNALQAASSGGHLEVMQLLLADGAHVNAQGGEYGNALYAVSEGGHVKAIQLLLDCGADVNVQGGYYGNALQAASSGGHVPAMELLLKSGAGVNVQGGYYGNALQAASSGGHRHAMQLLLNSGADVNAQGGYFRNALQAASSGGYLEALQLLLNSGADVNVQGGYFGNALQAASSGGYLEAMQLLLDSGDDVNAEGGEYNNALQAASSRGHIEAIQLLLDRGAKINADGGEYGNPLYAVSEGGNEKAVHLLLGQGADINAQGGKYGNPLQAASVRGDVELTQFLLEKGADPNASGGSYSKALHAASSQNLPRISLLLLRHGADVDARSESFETPLQAACVTGATEMAKLLLEYGANPNASPGSHGTALRAAALSGSAEIVLQLLTQGADLDPEISQNDALCVASRAGFKYIVRSLLNYGVLPNSSCSSGSALEMAKREGHSEVVDLLISAGALESTRVLDRTVRMETKSPDIKESTERQVIDLDSDDDSDMRTHAESVFSRQQFSVSSIPTTVSTTLHNFGIQRTSTPDIQDLQVRGNSSFQRRPLREERTVFQRTSLIALPDAGNLSESDRAIEIPENAVVVREKPADDQTDRPIFQYRFPLTHNADGHMLDAADMLEYHGTAATYGAASTIKKPRSLEAHHDYDTDVETWTPPENLRNVDSGDNSEGEAVRSNGAHLNVRSENVERQSQQAVSWCYVVRGLAKLHQTFVRWCRPKLRSGFSRLEWFCCCGQQFWGDFEHTEQDHLDRLILEFHQNGFKVNIAATSGASSTCGNNAHQQDITLTSRSSPSDSNKTTSTAGGPAPRSGDPSITVSQSAKSSFLDAGKPVYLELCVNKSSKTTRLGEIMLVPGRGEPLIKTDQQLFAAIRSKYSENKRDGFLAFLYRPQDIHYVEFGYQVAATQTDIYQTPTAIPPRKEVAERRYHYFESPLKTLPPMPKQTFYQYFYRHEPDCASRSILFCDRLPKKLGASLTTMTSADELAFGWGLHIIEGPNKPVLATLVAVILAVSFMISVFYDVYTGNKDSGFAIGQWVTGVLSATLAAIYFHFQET